MTGKNYIDVRVMAESAVEAKRIATSKNSNYVATDASLDFTQKRPYKVRMRIRRRAK